jgi:hypothetical protein
MNTSIAGATSRARSAPAPERGTRTSPLVVIATASPVVAAIASRPRSSCDRLPFTAAIGVAGLELAERRALRGRCTAPMTRGRSTGSPYAVQRDETTNASTTFITTPAIMMNSRARGSSTRTSDAPALGFGPNGSSRRDRSPCRRA